MSKRVLMLAYLFPPINDSGTQRPLKFTKYLPTHGWTPIVVTAASDHGQPVDPRLLHDIPPGVDVVRVPMLNEAIGAAIAKLTFGTAIGQRLADGVSWRLREPFKRPDLYALWRPTARRAAMRIFREVGFDAIYATGYPWTTLLIGCDVATATGRPLIADFRDPWASDDMTTVGRFRFEEEFAMERSVVKQAARVVSVTSEMTRRMQAAHPDVSVDKFTTIHNGFDPSDLEGSRPEAHRAFRFVYTGVWKENYGPGALYDVIDTIKRQSPSLLDGVEFIAAGFQPGEARRRSLDSHITEVGRLPHSAAVSLMRSADVLFLATAAGVSQETALPGKLFEYLATERPLLALTEPDGEAGKLLRRAGGAVVCRPGDMATFAAVVTEICRSKRLLTAPYDRAALEPFERSSLTKKLATLLDDVTAESQRE